ncbi:chlorite dismutase family protein [Castellaniella sp. MT123]|uniref:chlorite dismutase family protein n=1 Tax=Castellaniella sp. MT123 TaxID=3140381 RepID=UPI0031F3DB68
MQEQFTSQFAIKFTSQWNPLGKSEKSAAVDAAVAIFEKYQDRVGLRGTYVVQGFQGHTDILFWMFGDHVEDIQDLQLEIRRSPLGAYIDTPHAFIGITKPFEFSEHPTSFAVGMTPRKFLCFYPFIRTPEYYLLPAWERRAVIGDHGQIGHEFVPDILTNGVYGFGLGDYEWLLTFETNDLSRLVDCVRKLRESKSRLYMQDEHPFIVGRHFDLRDALMQYV